MRYIKTYKIFENVNFKDIVIDSIGDLTDDGYEVNTQNLGSTKGVSITKPGMEYNRQSFLGFNIQNIISHIVELVSHLDTYEVSDVYYHIKGYEENTWYSMDVEFKDMPKEPIDKLSIDFKPKEQ